MRSGLSLLLIILIGLVPFGAVTTLMLNESGSLSIDTDFDTTIGDATIQNGMNHIPVPGPDLGQANWSSNHFENPRFEDWSSPYVANGWSRLKTGFRYHWIETTQVNEGSQSAGVQCQNYPDGSARAGIVQSSINADFTNTTFTFDWYLDQNEDPNMDGMYTQVEIQNPDDGLPYLLYYYLNGSTDIIQWHSNSSNLGYFVFDMGPSQQWNTLSRNITADLLSVPSMQGHYSENMYVNNIYFRLEAYGGTDQLIRCFIDNVLLLNGTNSYYWINGTNRNGNFEGGFTSWEIIEDTVFGKDNHSNAEFERSATAYEGSYSANVTAFSNGNYSECSISDYPYTRLTNQNQGHVSMWWYLTSQHLTASTYAYIKFRCIDGGATRNVYYMLGYGGTSSPIANSSIAVVLKPESFNTTGGWNHLDVNLWTDANSHFSLSELMVIYVEVFVTAEGPGALISTLIDNISFRAAALNHADFEDQPAVGQPIQGFISTSSRFTVTGTAYGGSKAGNLTQTSGTLSLSHPMQKRPLNSSRETYLDAMWHIEETATTNQVWFRLVLTDGNELNYYMNGMTASPPNSSSIGYFNVTGAGTTGSWMQMHRDLAHDYEAVFGSLPDTSMEVLYLRASATSRLEILFDDFYLYDDPAPQISNAARDPTNPGINEPVNVTADAMDQDLDVVDLNYRVNTGSWGSWQTVQMDHLSGDTYNGTIPGQGSGAIVEYNITATDAWGMTTTASDNGNPWTYTVYSDTGPPSINSVSQDPTTVRYLDSVDVTADVTDDSVVASVELNYTTNGWATWNILTMSHTTGDLYEATIPAQNYDTTVLYSVNATDAVGNWVVDNNSGSYYSYTVIDNVDPQITGVGHSPDPVEYDDSPLIECDVSDPGSFLASVVLYYRFGLAGPWTQVAMANATGHYSASIPVQVLGTDVEYFINATDLASNWVTSGTTSYTVEDNTPPEITGLMRTPIDVEYGVSPAVECDVSDPGSFLASVVLYYRFGGAGSYTPVAMTNATGHYSASIPAQSWGTLVEYYVTATDNEGNPATTGTISYTVEDNTDPQITGVGQTPDPVEYDDSPLIECDVTDPGSFLASVVLYYRFGGAGSYTPVAMTNATGHYSASIPAQSWGTLVEYFINATDRADNWVTSGIGSYTVEDNTAPEISAVGHSPDPVEYDDDPVTVSCDVSDPGSGVASVTLYYSIDDWATWQTVAMTGVGTYSGNIPGYSWGITVLYNISATDGEGNPVLDDNGGLSYSYIVEDNTDPQITGVGHSPDPVEYDDSPLVECDVADLGSFLASVILYYQLDSSGTWIQLSMANATGHYSVNIPAQPRGTLVEYYVNATDQAGNWVISSTDSYTVEDNTAPDISSVTRNPLFVGPTDTPLIGSDVTDPGSGVNTVELNYTANGWATWNIILMTHTIGDHYEATLPTQIVGTFVEYFINATDNAGNERISSIYSYTVGDQTPPEITNIGHTPSPVEYSDAITFGCNVTDIGSGIDNVTLYYRLNGGSWQSILMNPTTGDRYECSIPALPWNTVVYYYVNATDLAGNEARNDNSGSYYTFTVVDTTDPILQVTAPSEGEEVANVVTITITASDLGSGLARIEIFINGTEIAELTNAPYNFDWNTITVSNGNYAINVTAYDTAGNTMSVTIHVTVNNLGATLPVIPAELIIGVSIVIVIVIISACVLYRRRRKF